MAASSSYAATAACLMLLITLVRADNAVLVFNNQAQGRVREQGVQNQISAKVWRAPGSGGPSLLAHVWHVSPWLSLFFSVHPAGIRSDPHCAAASHR